MNIVHLASGDLWAGAEVQLFHLSKRLLRVKDVNLLVVLLNHGKLETELLNVGVDVVVLDESQHSNIYVFSKFCSILKKFKADIIHTHRNKENVIGSLAARLNGKKSIRTEHGANEFSGKLFNIRRFVFDRLDRFVGNWLQQKIIAVSYDLKQKLLKIYAPEKIEILENCVDIDYIIKMSRRTSQWVVNPDVFNIAFVGRFVPVKRTDFFYAIAKSILSCKTSKPIHFHMIGDGPLRDDIMSCIEEDDLQSHMHLYGFVENTASLLKRMNLLVFTSDHEGLPMTLLEAMVLGVPVLSRNLPSIRSVLCDGRCGFITGSDEINEFSKIIVHLADDNLAAKAKIEMAKKECYEKYNITVNVNKYLDIYKRVLST